VQQYLDWSRDIRIHVLLSSNNYLWNTLDWVLPASTRPPVRHPFLRPDTCVHQASKVVASRVALDIVALVVEPAEMARRHRYLQNDIVDVVDWKTDTGYASARRRVRGT